MLVLLLLQMLKNAFPAAAEYFAANLSALPRRVCVVAAWQRGARRSRSRIAFAIVIHQSRLLCCTPVGCSVALTQPSFSHTDAKRSNGRPATTLRQQTHTRTVLWQAAQFGAVRCGAAHCGSVACNIINSARKLCAPIGVEY